jgi:GNAT superfamily N-acetyltransferase
MISYQTSSRLTDAVMAWQMLLGLEALYPEFGHWYTNRCLPGILVGDDTLLVAKDGHQIIGVAIGKRSAAETKLRCVRVLPEYQGRGIGIRLVEKTLRALDCAQPLCTVSEEMVHEFSRPFVNLFDFQLSAVEKGLYRPGKLEYIFNGIKTPFATNNPF